MRTTLLLLIFTITLGSLNAQVDSLGVDTSKIHYLSIEDAANYAVEHNYGNQNSKIDIEIAKKQIWETTAIGLPQVEATADYQNMLKRPTTLMPGAFNQENPGEPFPVQFGQQHTLSGTITATQLIFSGEYIVGLQAAKIFLELSKQSYSKSTQVIKETVTKTYYLTLITEESLKIMLETNQNLGELLQEIQESHRLGFTEDVDVDQLKLTKRNNDITISTLERNIELSRRLLKFQLGIDYQDSIVLKDSLPNFIENLDFDEILYKEFNIERNIDYKLIKTQEGLAMLNLKREKSTFLPQLSAFFTHSQNSFSNDFPDLGSHWYPSTIIGLQLRVPIFSSGMRRSRVQQKKLVLKQTQNTKLELEQNLKLSVAQLRSDFIESKNLFESQKMNKELSKRIHDKTEIKYKKGMASNNDLMIAQNQYLNALNNYYNSVSQLLSVRARLEYILMED